MGKKGPYEVEIDERQGDSWVKLGRLVRLPEKALVVTAKRSTPKKSIAKKPSTKRRGRPPKKKLIGESK